MASTSFGELDFQGGEGGRSCQISLVESHPKDGDENVSHYLVSQVPVSEKSKG